MSFTVIFCPGRLAKILLLMAGWWYSVLNCTSPFSLSSTSIVHVSKGSCTQVRKNNFYWCVIIYCKGNGMAVMLGTLLIYRVDNHTGNCTELHTYLMNTRLEYSNLESLSQHLWLTPLALRKLEVYSAIKHNAHCWTLVLLHVSRLWSELQLLSRNTYPVHERL